MIVTVIPPCEKALEDLKEKWNGSNDNRQDLDLRTLKHLNTSPWELLQEAGTYKEKKKGRTGTEKCFYSI